MLEHIAVYGASEQPQFTITVGQDDVKKAFFDEKVPSTLVVLTEDNIVEYHGFTYVVLKAYKK
jgi:hypothetical protein